MKFKREVTLLVVPFVLHMLISNSFSFIDTLMITGLGEVAVASVAAASQFSFVLGMVLSATYGMSAFITQFYGVNQMNNVYRTMGLMLTTSLLFSLFAFVLVTVFKEPLLSLFIKDEQGMAYGMQYVSVIVFVFVLNAIKDTYGHALGAIGKIKVNVIFGCIGMGFNTLFNYLLIYGVGWFPAYEVMGAAIATLLSTVISLLLVLGFVYGRRYYVNAHLKQLFSFNWSFSKRIYKTIYPLVLHEGIWSFGNMLYAVAFGHMGIVALATFQLARIFNQYFLMGISGFSYAARVMIGRKLSSDDPAEAITSARSFTRLAIYSAIVVSILIILLNPMIVNLFTELSPEVQQKFKNVLYIQGIVLTMYFLNHLWIVGVFRSGGDNVFSMKLVLCTTWFIALPLVFLGAYVFHWSIEVVYFMFALEEITKSIFGYFRYRSNKWARNLVEDFS